MEKPRINAEMHQITNETEDIALILENPKNVICKVGVLEGKDMRVERGRVLRMSIGFSKL